MKTSKTVYVYTATYSPEDDKLRLSGPRLESEQYARFKELGFAWAPKQRVLFATWSTSREDICLEFASEITDENITLAERAEERADRFNGYSKNRTKDADAAFEVVKAISEHIPMGQPILVGHHSERRARKDKERIENNMKKAVTNWKTAEYWEYRAQRVLEHAKFKELPGVRARRIAKLEAEKRKRERALADQALELKCWESILNPDAWKPLENGEKPDIWTRARYIANRSHLIVTKTNIDGTSFSGWSAYDVLKPDEKRHNNCPSQTPEQCVEAARQALARYELYAKRWLDHLTFRINYEKTLLSADGEIKK